MWMWMWKYRLSLQKFVQTVPFTNLYMNTQYEHSRNAPVVDRSVQTGGAVLEMTDSSEHTSHGIQHKVLPQLVERVCGLEKP